MNYEEWVTAGRPHWKCIVCQQILVTIPIANDFVCPSCLERDGMLRLVQSRSTDRLLKDLDQCNAYADTCLAMEVRGKVKLILKGRGVVTR